MSGIHLSIVVVVLIVGFSQAATITVCPGGCEYSSIQAAINAARDGDTINVQSGTYNEDLILTNNVKLVGVDTGNGNPVLNGKVDPHGQTGFPFSHFVFTGDLTFIGGSFGYPSSGDETSEPTTTPGTTSSSTSSSTTTTTGQVSTRYLIDLSGWKGDLDSAHETYYKDGKYHITVFKENYFTYAFLKGTRYKDFVLEVEATKEDGPNLNEYGVVLRLIDTDNFYRFKISGEGYWGFDKMEKGQWKDIIPMTYSAQINKGDSTNLIKVECKGNKFTFYVNGKRLTECSDSTFSSGNIGIGVGTHEVGGTHVSFSNRIDLLSLSPVEYSETAPIEGPEQSGDGYKESAGPWTIEFSSPQYLISRNNYKEIEGGRGWEIMLNDGQGHDVASFVFLNLDNVALANNQMLDRSIDTDMNALGASSSTKKSIKVDGVDGRLGEGYSSTFKRTVRVVYYPFEEYYDSFYHQDVTKDLIVFISFQDADDFNTILNSMHVTRS